MFRDQRVQDNWACIYAQKLALHLKAKFRIWFCVVPDFHTNTQRHLNFLLRGLKEVATDCEKLAIGFSLTYGDPDKIILDLVKEYKVGLVVTDFFPLRIPEKLVEKSKSVLPDTVVLVQVDSHNIVPCWNASDKQEYNARTIRKKINNKLREFLTEFPKVKKHPYGPFTIEMSLTEDIPTDNSVRPVSWIIPGTKAAIANLNNFLKNKIQLYKDHRNNPNRDVLSNLSPWLHFGHISSQRVVLETLKHKAELIEQFLDEIIVRRELSDNFCYYNKLYDEINSTHSWAKETLQNHADDPRQFIYSLKQLENAETHDSLWNASQIQMVKEGKMHGFLRMYWAKKILEWTKSPREALCYSIHLNDKYELDGNDPNGYVGCMWSVCGLHDRAWPERPIFGKIRYMSYEGSKRKFNVSSFETKHQSSK